jgi:PAS domain S-box-containing protein
MLSTAIALMNQFSYRKKFALLGVISLMSVSVLIYSLFLGLDRVVENSQRQLEGLKFIEPLTQLNQKLQAHRGLITAILAGESNLQTKVPALQENINTSLIALEQQLPSYLASSNLWIKINNNWNQIKSHRLDTNPADIYIKHSQAINYLQFFKVQIADEYSLTFDPNVDTFYLIDTIINKQPDTVEQLAQIRGLGTKILIKSPVSSYQMEEMRTLLAKQEASQRHLDANFNKIADFNRDIARSIRRSTKENALASQKVVKLVKNHIFNPDPSMQAATFFKQTTFAINRSYLEVYNILLPLAEMMIAEHLREAQHILLFSISISILLMLIVFYLGFGIYLSMNTNIQALSRALEKFSQGELQERIILESNDELNEIGNSFNQLAERITDLIDASEHSNKKLQQVLDSLLTMTAILEPDGTLDFANTPPLQLAGLNMDDIMGKKFWDCPWFVFDKSIRNQIRQDCRLAAQGESIEREIEFNFTGKRIWVDFSVHPVLNDDQTPLFLVAEARDATRRRIAEEHSKRNQKMNALGKLVGGIAHDYNNMLGVILGYAELMEMINADQPDMGNYINEIIRAGERGRALTRKMLAFSKSESSNPTACHINETLLSLKDMLSKSMTAAINLQYDLCSNPGAVWMDVNEFEDAILNLCINAKYAMPQGGVLTITTQNVFLNRDQAQLMGLTANDYVLLSITDTGIGMDQETQIHIFDPFFTTKGDAGNGLGLSQVFGFMERSGGAISVQSRLNKGSQFNLYFPRYHEPLTTSEPVDKLSEPQLTGDECILVVDDEPALRELANQLLTQFGYKVLTAPSGSVALNILAAQPVDLMLSDVIMPNMNGYELAKQVALKYPNVKIQLASGFNDTDLMDSEQYLRDNLLHKPYSSKELLIRIRFLLDGYLLPSPTSKN